MPDGFADAGFSAFLVSTTSLANVSAFMSTMVVIWSTLDRSKLSNQTVRSIDVENSNGSVTEFFRIRALLRNFTKKDN